MFHYGWTAAFFEVGGGSGPWRPAAAARPGTFRERAARLIRGPDRLLAPGFQTVELGRPVSARTPVQPDVEPAG